VRTSCLEYVACCFGAPYVYDCRSVLLLTTVWWLVVFSVASVSKKLQNNFICEMSGGLCGPILHHGSAQPHPIRNSCRLPPALHDPCVELHHGMARLLKKTVRTQLEDLDIEDKTGLATARKPP
jgi:hypothetical protein